MRGPEQGSVVKANNPVKVLSSLAVKARPPWTV